MGKRAQPLQDTNSGSATKVPKVDDDVTVEATQHYDLKRPATEAAAAVQEAPAAKAIKVSSESGEAAKGAEAAGGADAAGGVADMGVDGFADKAMFAVLKIEDPAMKPVRPVKPPPGDIMSGLAPPVREYCQALKTYVHYELAKFLYHDETVKLRKPLHELVCPDIDDKPKGAASGADWRPTSIMEPMNMDHCIAALTTSSFYEGAISFWNVDPFATKAFYMQLNLRDPTWLQFDYLTTGMWSEDVLRSSHDDQARQRYFWKGHVFSCVNEIDLLKDKAASGAPLSDMPVVCGHEVCWSFLDAMASALESKDTRLIRHLFEVSIQVPCRLRFKPTLTQLGLDRLSLSDFSASNISAEAHKVSLPWWAIFSTSQMSNKLQQAET